MAAGFSNLVRIAARPRDQAAGLGQILWPLHEGQGDPVDLLVQRELHIAAVFVGQRRESGSTTPGTFTPLRLESGPPAITSQLGEVWAEVPHPQADLAVIEQQVVPSGSNAAKISLCGRFHPVGVARSWIQVQAEAVAGCQLDLLVSESADPQFRSLHVGHDADGAPQVALNGPDIADPLCVARRGRRG